MVEAQVHRPKEDVDIEYEEKIARDSSKSLKVRNKKAMYEDLNAIVMVPEERIEISCETEELRKGEEAMSTPLVQSVKELTLISGGSMGEDLVETDILAMEPLYLPARTEVLCLGKLRRPLIGQVLVCEPGEAGQKDVQVAWSVVNNGDVVPVRLVNLSQVEVRLAKGQKLGKAVMGGLEGQDEVSRKKTVIGEIKPSSVEWLNEEFNLSHLNDDDRWRMCELLRDYSDLFRNTEEPLTSTTKTKHGITLVPGAKPIS